jgi:hypothetical protein
MGNGRDNWTDSRLDDLADRLTRFESRMDSRLHEIDNTLHGIQRSMIITLGTVLTVFGGIFAATNF